MIKLDCIIFSKDRPSQLNLLMRSMKDKFKNIGEVFVIYKASNDFFKKGYMEALYNRYYFDINVFPENNFKEQVIDIISNRMVSDCFLGLCDDDVFIKDIDTSDIQNLALSEDINAISIKGGLNIIGNYPNIKTDFPSFITTDKHLQWDWRLCRPDIDWGYPTCVNSYIWDRKYYLNLISLFDFIHPPTMEAGLNLNRYHLRKYMVSVKETCLLNIPANRIQTLSPNAFDSKGISIEDLNNKFLNGEIISTVNIYNKKVCMANENVEFIFEKQ